MEKLEQKVKDLKEKIESLEEQVKIFKEIHDEIRALLGLKVGEGTVEAVKKLIDNQKPDAQIINLNDQN